MPLNGSGTYSAPASSWNPAVDNTDINSTDWAALLADLSTALSTALYKDGQQVPTANIPMGGFKLTGLADGTTTTHAATVGQLQSSAVISLGTIAGTNTITAVGTPTVAAYAANQAFEFTPANTNTAATTLNINGLGAKNVFWNGAACSGGEIVQNVPVRVKYDGTQFNIIGPMIGTRITNTLGSDVALNNTANYFDGPSIAQGTVGTWLVTGSVTVTDSGGAARFDIKLWDGTTVISSGSETIAAAGHYRRSTFSGYITNPAANIKISVKDATLTTGSIVFNFAGNGKDSTLSAVRIA